MARPFEHALKVRHSEELQNLSRLFRGSHQPHQPPTINHKKANETTMMKFGSDDYSDGGDSSDASSIVDFSFLAPNNPALTERLEVAADKQEDTNATRGSQEEKNKPASSDVNTVRLVFGKSIRRWQARQNSREDNDSNLDSSVGGHVLVRQANNTQPSVRLEESRITSLSNDKLHLTTKDSTEFLAKLRKGGIPPTFDCIGIWDATQHAYVLEIPDYIATDLAPAASTYSPPSSIDHLSKNPLEQMRQAELKIRKRKVASASSQKQLRKRQQEPTSERHEKI
jgi:hypothetical protein